MDKDNAGRADAMWVVLVGMVSAMHIGKLPVSIPVLREDLGVSLLQAGFLLSLAQVAGMLTGLFVGLLADRFGPRRVMMVGLGTLSVGAAAGAFADSVEQLMWARGVEGAGFLLSVLPAPALLRRVVRDPGALSRALGWWGAYMPVGTASALVLGGLWIGWAGWRSLWIVLSLLSLACVWIIGLRMNTEEKARSVAGFGARLARTLSASGPWLAALAFCLYSGQWLAVVGFLPTIYAEAGATAIVVGWLSALAAGINMTGNIAAGRLLARGLSPGAILTTGYLAMALGSAIAFGWVGHPVLQYLGVLLFSAVGGLIPGSLFAMSMTLAPSSETVSTTVGWMQQWSSIGQFAGPPLVASFAVWAGGWHATWWVTGFCSLAGVVLAMCLQHRWMQLRSTHRGAH